jgi:formylglycine-generating enzyme required for sulfatase activity
VNGLIPLVVSLRAYRQYKELCCQERALRLNKPRADTLAGFIPWHLGKSLYLDETTDFLNDFFERLLDTGNCLLMLDGLDEVVNRKERGRVREQIERLTHMYPKNFILVTARETGYRDEAVFSSNEFKRLDVQALDEPQIHTLVENWCGKLYPEKDRPLRVEELMRAIGEINAQYSMRGIQPLISTPLMTTMVVSVKWMETDLPRERARLYKAAVRVVLQAQYLAEDETREELINLWGGDWEEQQRWLSILAWKMHCAGEGGAAVPEEFVRQALADEMQTEQIEQFIVAVRSRGGLFEERAELFQFLHLTFQEFLTAYHLVKEREAGLVKLETYITDPWWREVFLLAYGFAKDDYRPFAKKYLAWLSNQKKDDESHLAGLELAGAALLEIEERGDALVTRQLCDAIEDEGMHTPALLRARAGNTLAGLGDPRFDQDFWYLPRADALGFVCIPGGPFPMGSDPALDKKADKDEFPPHEVVLAEYYIARYPVMVAQWGAFVKDSGHIPVNDYSLKGILNHPLVSITWREALEYCAWLTEKLRQADRTPEPLRTLLREKGWRVSLPSEAEWEKAARGVQGRIYPWGNEFDPQKANTAETRIGTTSAVGCFAQGASPYELLDMCGNVWEWTRSQYRKYPYKCDDGRENLKTSGDARRVLRGGSFYRDQRFARCAARGRDGPNGLCGNLGFRAVVVPF